MTSTWLRRAGNDFAFYYEGDSQDLYITIRHGTSDEEAIDVFFGAAVTIWDEVHLRWESAMPKIDRSEIRVIADRLTEDEEFSEIVSRMEREADEEVTATTVTLRWARWQVNVVKRAAGIIGVPYQTYLKQVVFRQALEDITRAQVLDKQPRAPKKKSSAV